MNGPGMFKARMLRLLASALLVGSLLWGVTACAKGERAALELVPPRPVVWADYLGVNAHFLWFEPSQYRKQMDQLQAQGLQLVHLFAVLAGLKPQEVCVHPKIVGPHQRSRRHQFQGRAFALGTGSDAP